MTTRVRVFAPATVSNLGPGFDVLGLALQQPGDLVEAELHDEPGVKIVTVTGAGDALTTDPTRNVVGIAAADVLRRLQDKAQGPAPSGQNQGPRTGVGVRLWLHKQMPLASGLGSSAASSVAGALAVNELFGGGLSRRELVASALEGERAASGAPHADNAAPSLLGGIVLIRSYDPLELVSLPIPPELRVVVVHPQCEVATASARALVSERRYELGDVVANLGNVGALISALHQNDLELFGRSIRDRLVEPVRAGLIPGFQQVKDAALAAGALGCSISGSGPSVFAFSGSDEGASRVAAAMRDAFRAAADLESDVYVGPVNAQGASAL